MKILVSVLAAAGLLLAAGAAAAQTVAGDWVGTVAPAPSINFRLAVHIKQVGAGYAGALDDASRSIYGLPLTDVSVSGDSLSFKLDVPSASASFSGKWDAASHAWVGQWTQSGQSFPLTFTAGTWPPAPVIAGLDGAWDGLLSAPTAKLRLVLQVRTGAGGTVAWMNSLDQPGGNGLTVTALKKDGDAISFEMPALSVTFAGKLSADGGSIAGTFTQAGAPLPLTLARRAPGAGPPPAPAAYRPQTPKPPFPYTAQDVSFDGGAAGVKLAGTLTLPHGAGPFPAVVLVAGSGPATRDEEVAGHKIFLVLADYLTRHGVAVLRYDKRGVGQSTGDAASATTLDYAADAEAAAAYLRTRLEVDPARVGLIGHSEGGLIVPLVADRDAKVAFIVLMAGPGVDGADILAEQGRLIAKAEGMSDAQVAESDELRRQLIDIVRQEKDAAAAKPKLELAIERFAAAHNVQANLLEGQVRLFSSDWVRFFLAYDPAPALAKVRRPVLALDGSKDLQVPADLDLPPIRAALAHNPDATVIELPGLNHLFQPATTGAPTEYGKIETTIDPAALDLITGWILKHDGASRPT